MNHPTSIADSIRQAAAYLAQSGSTSARLDAEVLLGHVLGLDRTQLLARLREPVENVDRSRFDELVELRSTGEPVAYLTGVREFFGRPFAVGPGVLIPRPETELLVEWAVAWLGRRPGATVVDVGTGSGAIALSVAASDEGTRSRVVGVDSLRAALRFAEENRRRLGLDQGVHLVLGDLLTWCRPPIDLVVANLPYLRPEQLADNPELAAEPVTALVGGSDGLDPIRRLLSDTPRVLAPDGAVALEIDPSQATPIAKLARSMPFAARVNVLKDLVGWDRVVTIERG